MRGQSNKSTKEETIDIEQSEKAEHIPYPPPQYAGDEIFFHCPACYDERPSDMSPREFARLEVCLTSSGLQVTCVRHEKLLAHFRPRDLDNLLKNRPQCTCEECSSAGKKQSNLIH